MTLESRMNIVRHWHLTEKEKWRKPMKTVILVDGNDTRILREVNVQTKANDENR